MSWVLIGLRKENLLWRCTSGKCACVQGGLGESNVDVGVRRVHVEDGSYQQEDSNEICLQGEAGGDQLGGLRTTGMNYLGGRWQ